MKLKKKNPCGQFKSIKGKKGANNKYGCVFVVVVLLVQAQKSWYDYFIMVGLSVKSDKTSHLKHVSWE